MDFNSRLHEFRTALAKHAPTYGISFTAEALAGLSKYYELLGFWNNRLHLVAPTSPAEFATRHILESLMLLEQLPRAAVIADIGSGAGLPIIPCLIVRPELRALLIEASAKKAVFLKEALRAVLVSKNELSNSEGSGVIAARFESIPAPQVDFITCRALERFEEMLPKLLEWAPSNSTLLLFGGEGLRRKIEASGFVSSEVLIPNSQQRFLFIINKATQSKARA